MGPCRHAANQLREEQLQPPVALVQLPHGEEPVREARLRWVLLGQRDRHQGLTASLQPPLPGLQCYEKKNANYYFFQPANQLGEDQPRPLVALQLPHEEPLLLLSQRDDSHQRLATSLQLPLVDLQRSKKKKKNIHIFKKEFVSKVRRSPPPKEAVDQWRSGGALPLIWGKAATRAIPFFHRNKYVSAIAFLRRANHDVHPSNTNPVAPAVDQCLKARWDGMGGVRGHYDPIIEGKE